MSKHLLDFKDIEKKDIEKLIDITGKLNPEKTDEISSISLLKFDEPSTRTRLSFSVAAYRLGIKTFESSDMTSAKIKGENLIHEIETYKSMGIKSIVIRTKEDNIDKYREFKDISVISGDFDIDLLQEFFQGFVNHAKATIHIDNIRGGNAHHIAETIFKAFAKALKMAVSMDSNQSDKVPSTKELI